MVVEPGADAGLQGIHALGPDGEVGEPGAGFAKAIHVEMVVLQPADGAHGETVGDMPVVAAHRDLRCTGPP